MAKESFSVWCFTNSWCVSIGSTWNLFAISVLEVLSNLIRKRSKTTEKDKTKFSIAVIIDYLKSARILTKRLRTSKNSVYAYKVYAYKAHRKSFSINWKYLLRKVDEEVHVGEELLFLVAITSKNNFTKKHLRCSINICLIDGNCITL